MPDIIPTMSLKAAPIQFAEFKPLIYTPQEPNLELLNRSMEKIEARNIQARANADAFINATNVLRKQLNPAELEAFDTRINAMEDQINDQIKLGNTASAVLMASDFGRTLAADEDVQNRIRTQESFTAARNEAFSKGLNSISRRRWDDLNTYRYDGTGKFTPDFNPITDMSFDDIMKLVVANTPTRSDSRSWNHSGDSHQFVDSKGNITNTPSIHMVENRPTTIGTFSKTQTSNGGLRSYTEKKEDDMYRTFQSMLTDSNIKAALLQEFQNMIWLRNKAQSILDDPNSTEAQRSQAKTDLITANESIVRSDGNIYQDTEEGFNKWLDDKVKTYFRNAAWRHETRQDSDSNHTDYGNGFNLKYTTQAQQKYNQYKFGDATVQSGNLTVSETATLGEYNANNAAGWFITPVVNANDAAGEFTQPTSDQDTDI